MTRKFDAFPDFWPPEPDPSRRAAGGSAAGPAPTPAMRRAEETTRVAREAIDAATAARHAQVAKLKAARLGVVTEVAPEPAAKPKRSRKKPATPGA